MDDKERNEELVPIDEILSAYLPPKKAPELTLEPAKVPEAAPVEAAPKKNPPVKKFILWATALAAALAVAAGIVLWKSPPDSPSAPTTAAPVNPEPAPSGGFYLLTSATEYNADGTLGSTQRRYTYNHLGAPLSVQTDYGVFTKEVWNDEDGVYESIYSPFDGNVDILDQFVYNENGHIIYNITTRNNYDQDGNLIYSDTETNDRDKSCHYEYATNGLINAAILHKVQVGGGTDSDTYPMYYHYNSDGMPYEIFLDAEQPYILFEFRYDSEGRLTAAAKRQYEGLFALFYEYDENGRLTRITQQTNSFYASLDDQSINPPLLGDVFRDHQLESTTMLEYDGDNLIRRTVLDADARFISSANLEYVNGQLSKVTYSHKSGTKTVYRFAKESDGESITLVQDANGNIVRQIFPDGSFILYEYQRFDLPDEAIQQAKNLQYVLNGVDATGEKNHQISHPTGGMAFMAYVPYPTTTLYPIDILHQQ